MTCVSVLEMQQLGERKLIAIYFDDQTPSLIFQAKMSHIASSSFLNIKMCGISLSFMKVNEESFDCCLDKSSNLKMSLRIF